MATKTPRWRPGGLLLNFGALAEQLFELCYTLADAAGLLGRERSLPLPASKADAEVAEPGGPQGPVAPAWI